MGYSPQGHKEVDTTERLSTHRDELFIIFIFGCAGSSLCGVVVCRLSCSVACGMLVPPAGIKPESPALEGRFSTTGPAGKSQACSFLLQSFWIIVFALPPQV